tara:strand:- start:2182 stop:2475 length:294 start_codon:yes stop_codon:yes gene_type:complete
MDKRGFEIPQSMLRQLNEFSDGGFVLFTFDDNGNPNVHSKFDTNKDAMALQMFISNYAEAIEEISVRSTLNSISSEDPNDITDDFFDLDDENEDDLF